MKDRRHASTARRHAAIVFTDIVGYTALMGSDEDKAFEVLRKNREIHTKYIEQFNGTLIKEMGDGMLISFDLASEAVRCAIEIQKACKPALHAGTLQTDDTIGIPLKIGIHEGEMVFDDNDVLGDGVNIASRLQDGSEEGCITISGSVYRDIKNKAGIQAEFVGEKQFKNIDEKIKVFRVNCSEGVDEISNHKRQITINYQNTNSKKRKVIIVIFGFISIAVLSILIWWLLPVKKTVELEKSIAVLPFDYLSHEKDKQYLADGVMDAITSNLAKISELKVIAKTTVEKYGEHSMDARNIGKEIGVSYIVEGSFQLVGNDARLIIQLINTKDGSHVWSDEFDRDWTEIFKVQSEVSQTIAKEIAVKITPETKKTIESIPTTDLTAYDYYLRGEEYSRRSWEEQDYRYAIQMYEKAIEIDPKFTLAWVGLANASRSIYWTYYDKSDEQILLTKQYLDKAIALSPQSKEVLLQEGMYYYHCKLDYPKALQIFEKLVSDYPNDDDIYVWVGSVYRRMGDFRKSLEYFYKSVSLNPSKWNYLQFAGQTLRVLGEYNDAENYLKKVIDINPSFHTPYWNLLYLYTIKGDIKKAKEFLLKHQEFVDHPTITLWRGYIELLDKNYEKAIQVTASLSDSLINEDHYFYCSKNLQLGLIYHMMSHESLAVKHFEAESMLLEEKIENSKNDHRLYSSLGIAYAGLGQKEKAIESGEKAIEILGFDKDAYAGFYPEMDMTKILLLTGKYEEVLSRLEYLLSRDGSISVELLKIDPFWDPIREMDEFKAILNNPEYQVNLAKN